MKFKCKVTEEVIQKTAMCGVDESKMKATNCLFAYIYNQLIPNVFVAKQHTFFLANKGGFDVIATIRNDKKLIKAIRLFDFQISIENRRANFLNEEYELEIPDEVITYWHGDTVKAVQHLIDNPILQPA